MSVRYSILPNPRSAPDAECELNDAFESDDNDHEFTPLTHGAPTSNVPTNLGAATTSSIPTYDFERDYEYDYPPPGSPPRPSEFALPNDFGNSNGQMPGLPVRRTAMPRPSFFHRAVGALLPTHYTRLPTEESSTRTRGGGIENDGVFANVMAKPQKARTVRTEDGEIHMVPEDAQKDAPPSYADAQADTVPPYWETTVHAPSGVDQGSDMIIDDLPSGSVWIFALNLFTSFFFQFVGFLLTYILHTSHAGKFGSRAGLGLTLIQYGFFYRAAEDKVPDGNQDKDSVGEMMWFGPSKPSSDPLLSTSPAGSGTSGSSIGGVTSREWLSFLFMTLGWFLLLSSLAGFWRVKRWETSIRASSNPVPRSLEDIERDIEQGMPINRRNVETIFEASYAEEVRRENMVTAEREALAHERLARELSAAGLL